MSALYWLRGICAWRFNQKLLPIIWAMRDTGTFLLVVARQFLCGESGGGAFDHKVLWREPLSSLLFGTALNLVKIIIKGYVLSTPHSNDFNLFVRPI